MNTPATPLLVNRVGLDEVVNGIDHLPTLPTVVIDLLNSVAQEDIDIGTLAKKISVDQALTAKALRSANSSFYGAQSKIATIQQAASLLGVRELRNLVIASALAGAFPKRACKGFDFDAFWRHSVATAVCAKVLARHLHLNQNYAFTAGLLHDIGRLVLVVRFTTQYEAAIAYRAEHDCHMLDAERSVMGIDHTMAGQALAERWQFSEMMQQAIGSHHDPDPLGAGSLASLLHVANAIVHALDLANDPDDMVPPVSLIAWHGLGMNTYAQVFRETELEFEAMSLAL